MVNLSAMSALDVEQFALKSGPLEHETRKNKWDKIHAILWHDPAIAIDETCELGLLLLFLIKGEAQYEFCRGV